MNNSKKSFRLFALLSMLTAAAGGVLLFIAFYSDYDLSIRHFEKSSALAVAAGCAVAVGVLLAIAATILLSKKACPPSAQNASSAAVFVSVFSGCLIIGNTSVNVIFNESAVSILTVIAGLFAVLSGVYMIISPLRGTAGKTAVKLLSMAPALWMGFNVISAYRVTDTAMNDPFNTYYALALISLLLFFTSSVGVSLHPQSRRGFYTLSSYLLLSVGGGVILSRLILSLIQKAVFNVSMLESIMFLALYIYAAMQVFSMDSIVAAADTESAETESETDNSSENDSKSDE